MKLPVLVLVLVCVLLAFLPVVVLLAFFFVMVMAVEFGSEGHPVTGIVGAYANADEGSLAKPAEAAVAVRGPGLGILDVALGRGVFPTTQAIRPAPHPPAAGGEIESGCPSCQGVARPRRALEVALQAVRMRDEARMAADCVHYPSHGVAAVE